MKKGILAVLALAMAGAVVYLWKHLRKARPAEATVEEQVTRK